VVNRFYNKIFLLKEGLEVEIESHEGDPINIIFPDQVTLTVTKTEPTFKGQTTAASYKPAKLVNGLRVMVPPFIENGQNITINTTDLTYLKRSE
jgi:elongation factor P|tara:strand:+ start:720 stop:1001 length:282 start_codon:yes stop_codon:yes gene_type:complete